MGQNRDQKQVENTGFARAFGIVPAALCLCFAQPLLAQSGTGDVRVTINRGVQVVKDTDLDFGDFASGTVNSVFRLNPNNGNLNQRSGNAVSIGGIPTPAAFTASGTPLLRVRITSNQNRIFIVRDGGTETMRVNRFRFDGRRNRFLDASGDVTYRVGGQLRVGPNQAPGTYRGTFNVTIDYF